MVQCFVKLIIIMKWTFDHQLQVWRKKKKKKKEKKKFKQECFFFFFFCLGFPCCKSNGAIFGQIYHNNEMDIWSSTSRFVRKKNNHNLRVHFNDEAIERSNKLKYRNFRRDQTNGRLKDQTSGNIWRMERWGAVKDQTNWMSAKGVLVQSASRRLRRMRRKQAHMFLYCNLSWSKLSPTMRPSATSENQEGV